jgi:hypothetical protein
MGSTGRAAFSPAGAGYSAGETFLVGRTSTAGVGAMGGSSTAPVGSPTGAFPVARLRSHAVRVSVAEDGAQRLATGAPVGGLPEVVGSQGPDVTSPGAAATGAGAGVSGGRVSGTSPVPGVSPRPSGAYPSGARRVTSQEEAQAHAGGEL